MAQLDTLDLTLSTRISEIYSRGIATVAALTSIEPRLETEPLRRLVENYLAITRSQIARAEALTSDYQLPLTAADDEPTRADLRDFARELARGLLSSQLEVAAVDAMLRLSLGRLDSYQRLEQHANPAVAALGLAGIAEETAMIDTLAYHREALQTEHAPQRLAE